MITLRILALLGMFLVMVAAGLRAAPIPFNPYGEQSSANVVLRLAQINDLQWSVELKKLMPQELSRITQAELSIFETWIKRHHDNELAMALLVPLHWFISNASGHAYRHMLLLANLDRNSDDLIALSLIEQLLQFHELSLPVINGNHHLNQSIRLKYDHLLLQLHKHKQRSFLNVWASAVLYFYRPGGGLASADAWLKEQNGISAFPEIITVYRKILHDVAGQTLPSTISSCWPLTCANAMIINEMTQRAQLNKYGLGRAWQQFLEGVNCLYNHQSNYESNFDICLERFHYFNYIISTMVYSKLINNSDEGLQEYNLLKKTYTDMLQFEHKSLRQENESYRKEKSNISKIEDTATRLKLWENLMDSSQASLAYDNSLTDTYKDKLKEYSITDMPFSKKVSQLEISGLSQDFKNREKKILHGNGDVEHKMTALIDLLNSDLAESLTANSKNSLTEHYQSQLYMLTLKKRERLQIITLQKKFYVKHNEIFDRVDYDAEAKLIAIINLLNSDLAKSIAPDNKHRMLKHYQPQLNEIMAMKSKIPVFASRLNISFSDSQNSIVLSGLTSHTKGQQVQGIELTEDNIVKISYQYFPREIEQIIDRLSHRNNDVLVEFIDDSCGDRKIVPWKTLDKPTQDHILGSSMLLSVLLPGASVKISTDQEVAT